MVRIEIKASLTCDYINPEHDYMEGCGYDDVVADDRAGIYKKGSEKGWNFPKIGGKKLAKCPDCVKKKIMTVANGGKGY